MSYHKDKEETTEVMKLLMVWTYTLAQSFLRILKLSYLLNKWSHVRVSENYGLCFIIWFFQLKVIVIIINKLSKILIFVWFSKTFKCRVIKETEKWENLSPSAFFQRMKMIFDIHNSCLG